MARHPAAQALTSVRQVFAIKSGHFTSIRQPCPGTPIARSAHIAAIGYLEMNRKSACRGATAMPLTVSAQLCGGTAVVFAVKQGRRIHHRDTEKKPGDDFGTEPIGGGSPSLCASVVNPAYFPEAGPGPTAPYPAVRPTALRRAVTRPGMSSYQLRGRGSVMNNPKWRRRRPRVSSKFRQNPAVELAGNGVSAFRRSSLLSLQRLWAAHIRATFGYPLIATSAVARVKTSLGFVEGDEVGHAPAPWSG
jgi:hypothetical protein